MNCPSCHAYVSGDFCLICEKIIHDKKPLKKTINKKSEKRELEDQIYSVLRRKFLRDHPRCEVFPDLKSNQIHHKRGRIGENYLDVKTWMAVSDRGHRWIHDNDFEARQKGFLLTRTL